MKLLRLVPAKSSSLMGRPLEALALQNTELGVDYIAMKTITI